MARAKRVCSCRGCAAHDGNCPAIVTGGRCPSCSTERNRTVDAQRGSRQSRGYDAAHDRLRKRWAAEVATGMVACARCGALINPLEHWHLDHTDDRNAYLGPSHAVCNLSAAGVARHAT